jgi:hypothetical protein
MVGVDFYPKSSFFSIRNKVPLPYIKIGMLNLVKTILRHILLKQMYQPVYNLVP